MSLQKIRIFELHYTHTLTEENDVKFIPRRDDGDENEWKRFDLYIETDAIKIDSFREDVLFSGDNPQKCVRITFSDGSFVFGCYAIDTFVKLYEDDYLPKLIRFVPDPRVE